jgi:hypothetical protein
MKKSLVFVAVACLAASLATAQSPRGQAELAIGGKNVSVDYGRPSLKGRDMLARAAVGSDWRMGADAATKLVSEADLMFGEAKVPAGSYTLSATKLAEDAWRLNVQDKDGKRTAEIPLKLSKLDEALETFTIKLQEKDGTGHFWMAWGDAALSAEFTAK